MKPTVMRRSDAFFLVLMFVYIAVVISVMVTGSDKYLTHAQIVWVVFLLIGAGIKVFKNPWQKWFLADIHLFGPKPLSPDDVLRLTQNKTICDYPSKKMFPPIGLRGVYYLALDTNLVYIWDNPEKGYLQVVANQ